MKKNFSKGNARGFFFDSELKVFYSMKFWLVLQLTR